MGESRKVAREWGISSTRVRSWSLHQDDIPLEVKRSEHHDKLTVHVRVEHHHTHATRAHQKLEGRRATQPFHHSPNEGERAMECFGKIDEGILLGFLIRLVGDVNIGEVALFNK